MLQHFHWVRIQRKQVGKSSDTYVHYSNTHNSQIRIQSKYPPTDKWTKKIYICTTEHTQALKYEILSSATTSENLEVIY